MQLGDRLVGQAALTDLHDAWVDNALEGLSVGQGVRAQLLPLAKGGSTGGCAVRGRCVMGAMIVDERTGQRVSLGSHPMGYVHEGGWRRRRVCALEHV